MSKSRRFWLSCVALAALTLSWSGSSNVSGTAGAAETARLETFTKPDGSGFFALSVVPPATLRPQIAGHDIVVLVDTSASQANEYRTMSLDALDFFLAGLGDNDRVHLSAVDLTVVPLTKTFVSPAGAEMRAALDALSARTPLGTTDMGAALRSAASAFDNIAESPDRARAGVYIGDGMSVASLLAIGEMQSIVDSLQARHVAVSSYAIGPRTDARLLGVLANHTGGMLIVDSEDLNGKQAGVLLAQSAVGAVAWPTSAVLPKEITEIFPKKFPPLRFDRDTIVIGVGKPAGDVGIRVVATIQGKPADLAWTVAPISAADDHSYLPELIASIRKDGGISLPTVGSWGLKEMRRLVHVDAYSLLQLGKQASAVGSYDQADRLLGEALRLDPQNGEALALRQSVRKALKEGKSGGSRDLRLLNFQVPQPVDPAAPAAGAAPAEALAPPAAAPVDPGTFGDNASLAEVQKRLKVFAEQVTAETLVDINRARGLMDRDPEQADEMLKRLLDQLRSIPELDASTKTRLRDLIETTLRGVDRARDKIADQQIRLETVLARKAEEDRLYRDLIVGQEKAVQLMARFENLMDERRYRDAENTARMAVDVAPGVQTAAAVLNAQRVRAYSDMVAMREFHQLGGLEALQSIERSAAPFSDQIPVVYPPRDVWELMTERRKKFERVSLGKQNEAETRITEELDNRTDVQYLDTQLGDVVNDLELRHKINIELDMAALTADGKGPETLINKQLKDLTLRSALRLILEEQGLTYVIENEVLLITTKTAAETKVQTRVYPVADLVVPIPQGGLSGFGGLGGGQGGGMGGGGGGLGGGGGGGGGLGGGGGMFAVEDAVGGDLRLSASPSPAGDVPAAVVPKAAVSAAVSVQPKASPLEDNDSNDGTIINLKMEAGADVCRVWDAHFAATKESPAAVRTTVRSLLRSQKPDQVSAVIMAAMKNAQGQPWMYEALGLAMEMQGARVSEIERALMSAVDLSNQPSDLMKIADYMVRSNLGGGALQGRALELYRQVSKLQPMRPEPYVLGLGIAKHTENLEGLKWTSLGILSQGWTHDQQPIFDEAKRVAAGLLDRLRAEGTPTEVEAFQKALKDALVRDCVITVSWTGDADVDLVVQEPGGTVCSFRNPRSPAGGVLIEDTFDKATGLRKETYVCPLAFTGDYRMMAKRVWGKVTADTVSVLIVAHQGSPAERRIQKNIKLENDEAPMAFDMQNGRRVEALDEVQVANAAESQRQIGNAILAQQLGALNNPDVVGGGVNPFDPRFFLRGAVGYQPIIITLPEGTNMAVTSVVSHDRRYVRVSAQPLFSSIPRVNTFNYVSGSGGTTGGGTGS